MSKPPSVRRQEHAQMFGNLPCLCSQVPLSAWMGFHAARCTCFLTFKTALGLGWPVRLFCFPTPAAWLKQLKSPTGLASGFLLGGICRLKEQEPGGRIDRTGSAGL